MALPTFFIIGAAKCGTTSLHSYLDQHPQIQMSAVKETHFFSGPENGIPYPADRVSRLEDYERLFDPGARVRGEASPSYTAHPRRRGVPERIRELVPEARFIYLVRDPVDRTVSHYLHRVAIAGERQPLSDALGDLSDPFSPYVAPSRYATQLKLYLTHFPQERFLVVDQVDLLGDRSQTLRRIFTFLEVDSEFQSTGFAEEHGTTRDRRSYGRGWVELMNRAGASPLRLLPPRLRHAARRRVERTLWPPLQAPALDDDLRGRLQQLYADETAGLRALTGQAFSTWSV